MSAPVRRTCKHDHAKLNPFTDSHIKGSTAIFARLHFVARAQLTLQFDQVRYCPRPDLTLLGSQSHPGGNIPRRRSRKPVSSAACGCERGGEASESEIRSEPQLRQPLPR